jgi:hypothetical protein
MSDIQELIDRCTRMSLILGIVTGCLLELIRDDRLPNIMKEPLYELLTRVTNGIDELFYNDKPKEELLLNLPENEL